MAAQLNSPLRMTADNCLDAIAQSARQRRLMIFCGAGLSLHPPSTCASWWDIYAAAANALADRLADSHPAIAALIPPDRLLGPLSTQQLADLVIQRFAGETFTELLSAVDVSDINENHRAVASIAAMGGLRAVLTTNFDTLIERAASSCGYSFAVVTPSIGRHAGQERQCKLIKLHGSTIDPAAMVEASWHKAREVSPLLIEAWTPLVNDCDLLVVGFSGADLGFGAVGAFFTDLLGGSGRIWWLHLPDRLPSLAPALHDRTILMEGMLPDVLSNLMRALGTTDFSTPATGFDARAVLSQAMDRWSRALHVGCWAAATFYLSLCEHETHWASRIPLRDELWRLAHEQASRFQSDSQAGVEDVAITLFVNAAGQFALARGEFAGARALLSTTLRLDMSFDAFLTEAGDAQSADERYRNMAAAWGNYAFTFLFEGKIDEAFNAFVNSMIRAYQGRNVEGLLLGLTNILNYCWGLTEVRRSMRLAELAVQLADIQGFVQASIELRLLLGLYCCDRNEIWRAQEWLHEAKERAAAVGEKKYAVMATIQMGECVLKSGRIAEGLTLIADVVEPGVVNLARGIDEVGRYLDSIGIPQDRAYRIALSPEQVPELADRIAAERAAARSRGDLPWRGAHCAVSPSAFLDEIYGRVLFLMGSEEFDGNTERAVDLGLALAYSLLSQNHFVDASWVARNVLANPAASAPARAQARGALAHALAAMGRLEQARDQLGAAERAFTEAAMPIPAALAEVGVWYFVQSNDANAALRWAGLLARAVAAERDPAIDLAATARQIDSWGAPMAAVAQALRVARPVDSAAPAQDVAAVGLQLYRKFRGQGAFDSKHNEKAGPLLEEAKRLMTEKRFAEALSALGRLDAAVGELSQAQIAFATVLRVNNMAPQLSVVDLEKFAETERKRLLASLSFTALACLERAATLILVERREFERVNRSLDRYGWIWALAEDSLAAASLAAWEAHRDVFLGRALRQDPQARQSRRLVQYFGVDDAGFGALAEPRPTGKNDREAAADLIGRFRRELQVTKDPRHADALLRDVVRTLRKERNLTREVLTELRDCRALWALQIERFEEAAQLYERVQRSFRSLRLSDGMHNAMAGQARALSRAGRYTEAVAIFTRAADEANQPERRANFLLGLGMAHLREGTKPGQPLSSDLIKKAARTFQQAVTVAPRGSLMHANARLAQAKALGMAGQQQAALDELDLAISEMAHLGSAVAATLMENRGYFAAGAWHLLQLS